jgi:hypothetical protein
LSWWLGFRVVLRRLVRELPPVREKSALGTAG